MSRVEQAIASKQSIRIRFAATESFVQFHRCFGASASENAISKFARDLRIEQSFFFEELKGISIEHFAAWTARRTEDAATLFPLGEGTADALALVEALAPKMDQFFSQCAFLAIEAGGAARLQATPEELAALDVSSPTAIGMWMACSDATGDAAETQFRRSMPARGVNGYGGQPVA